MTECYCVLYCTMSKACENGAYKVEKFTLHVHVYTMYMYMILCIITRTAIAVILV